MEVYKGRPVTEFLPFKHGNMTYPPPLLPPTLGGERMRSDYRFISNNFFSVHFGTKVSINFWNLRDKTDFFYTRHDPFWEKNFPTY
jgi:hypothetical protein